MMLTKKHRKTPKLLWVLPSFFFLGMIPLAAQDFPFVEFNLHAQGLDAPVDLVGSPFGNNDLYIVQRGSTLGSAQIKVISAGTVLATPFLTVTGIICCGERGLLSMVFHPNALTNGIFFVLYTAAGDGAVTVARYKLKTIGNFYEADPDSRQVILSMPHPVNTNHNGGKLLFGPDGFLYLGTGDGGGGNDPWQNAQNPQSLLGKILRINPSINSLAAPHYTIPADNPYLTPGDGILDEIFAIGVRNPWRWSFDHTTGNAWIADVGQSTREELNMVTPAGLKGANFGWRCFEGTSVNNAAGVQPCVLFNGQTHTPPGYVYPHNNNTGGFSVTGGYVYRGVVYPKLTGFYLMSDYISGALWTVKIDGSFGALRQTDGVPPNISGFGETADKELWAISLTEGKVYSIKAEGTLSATPLLLRGKTTGLTHILDWEVLDGNRNDQYVIEAAIQNANPLFNALSTISSKGSGRQQYSYSTPATGQVLYRVKTISGTGNVYYSQSLLVGYPAQVMQPTLSRQGSQLVVQLPEGTRFFRVTDVAGRLLYAQKVQANTQRVFVSHAASSGGRMVILETNGTTGRQTQKFWVE